MIYSRDYFSVAGKAFGSHKCRNVRKTLPEKGSILGSESSGWFRLAKLQKLILPTITLIGKGKNPSSLCA